MCDIKQPFKNVDLDPINVPVKVECKITKITKVPTINYSKSYTDDSEDAVYDYFHCNFKDDYNHSHYDIIELLKEFEKLLGKQIGLLKKNQLQAKKKYVQLLNDCRNWQLLNLDINIV